MRFTPDLGREIEQVACELAEHVIPPFVVSLANLARNLQHVCNKSGTKEVAPVAVLDRRIEIDDAAPLEEVKMLLREYPSQIPVPLEVQDFEAWLDSLPGPYAPPGGRLLVVRFSGESAGCVALRGLGGDAAEVKRLYVRERFRGLGLARALVQELIDVARAAGYARLRLDTHSSMIAAQTLYRWFGFTEIAPYWDHPVPDVVFFELNL
jgi:GNAT superfamily N-acetyltransferase